MEDKEYKKFYKKADKHLGVIGVIGDMPVFVPFENIKIKN